jgi:transcriptional antiterminator RfaH
MEAGMRMETMGEGGAGGRWSGETGRRWFVVQTKAGCDRAAEDHVRSLGIETYRPELETVRVTRGRKVEVIRPMFPCYLFARFDPLRDDWMRIGRHNYLAKVLAAGPPFYTPKALPVGFVEQMRESGLRFCAPEKAKPFQVGESVRVLEGPFAGFVARVASLDDRMRVVVLLAFMGEQHVAFDAHQLVPA